MAHGQSSCSSHGGVRRRTLLFAGFGAVFVDNSDEELTSSHEWWSSTVTDGGHDREVSHSPTVGLRAVPVRPPTEIAGFIYRHNGVRIRTSDSGSRSVERTAVVVSAGVGFIPRLKPLAVPSKRCNGVVSRGRCIAPSSATRAVGRAHGFQGDPCTGEQWKSRQERIQRVDQPVPARSGGSRTGCDAVGGERRWCQRCP